MSAPNETIAGRLLKQSQWCQDLGSLLYSQLLRRAAADVRTHGVCWSVLQGHHDDPPGSALALRFLGAIHRLVLQGDAPELAACYPSAGGAGDCEHLWPRFRNAVQQHGAKLRGLVHLPVQTNEVGRCAALMGGFLQIAADTRLPLRLLEVGAAAGLILRWDQYRYEEKDGSWGDVSSPVCISGAFAGKHPSFDVEVSIAERRGCDTSPLDAGTEEGKLTLQSYVWPDQLERFHRLSSAIEVASTVPAQIDRANAADWIETLPLGTAGVASVIYHSIVWQYLSSEDRIRIEKAITSAGRIATPTSPLAWLRFEPGRNTAEVHLRLWPSGEDRLLAQSGFHGSPIHWLSGRT